MSKKEIPEILLRVRKAQKLDKAFGIFSRSLLWICLLFLFLILFDLLTNGWTRLNWNFFTSFPSRFPDKAGILSALVGSTYLIVLTFLIAVPLGLSAGIYLEEYAPKNKITRLIELSIANLAAVPSIIFGLLALGIFVRAFGWGPSILTGAFTLSLLILPIVIVATRESLKTIPLSLREAALALGATRLEVVRHHLLPLSLPGAMTGIIIAISRALGETAPLITIGALTFIAFLPHPPYDPAFLFDPFTALPIQMFNWVSRPQVEFHQNAAAAGLVLLGLTLTFNLSAILLRAVLRRKQRISK